MGKTPWITIWTHPRKTIRHLIDTNPKGTILYLAFLSGILSALSWLAFAYRQYPEKENLRHPLVILGTLFGGAALGGAHLYFGSWLYRMTGSWIGGSGKFDEVKCAIGWSYWPMIIVGLFHNLLYAAVTHPVLFLAFSLIGITLYIWSFMIFFQLIGEAHRFSSWRAVGAVAIAFVLVFVAMMIFSLLIPLLRPLFQWLRH